VLHADNLMRDIRRIIAFCLCTLGCAPVGGRAVPSPAARVYEIRGGHWLAGDHFEDRTMYMSAGRFAPAPGRAADSVIHVDGEYVVPPFAEAHNHWLEPKGIRAYVQASLRDGVFYVRDMGNAPAIRSQIDTALNTPTSVDFVSANQGWTAPGGHPLQIAQQFVRFGVFPAAWADSGLDRNVVNVVRDSADVAARWPAFLQGHPDFVKVFLLNSEDFATRANDSAYVYRRGINPALVSEIVRRAHAAGLRVAAHIYTAADFRAALDGGVDIIAHFPGTGLLTEPQKPLSAFAITDADARKAAERRVPVTTTLYWLPEIEDSLARERALAEVIRPNLALLRKHGVRILIGSDEFRGTSSTEADVLIRFGLFTPADLLRAWSVETPRDIFPGRRIGELSSGAEASFLALRGNPLTDFRSVHAIALRVKQGRVLQLDVPPPQFPGIP